MLPIDNLDGSFSHVEGKLDTASAALRVLRFSWDEPTDGVVSCPDMHLIDLCPTRRPPYARGCYTERWSAHRFERLGRVYIVPAGQQLHARSEAGRQKAIMCWINRDRIEQMMDMELRWSEAMLRASLDVASRGVARTVQRLAVEAANPGFASETMTELLFCELAIELCRYFSLLSDRLETRTKLSAKRLRLIDDRLDDMSRRPSLEELARLCGLSVRQLTRSYRQSRGVSIHEDIADRQIRTAKALLLEGAHAKTVAFDLGFASPSAFSFAFRRATGKSPREFRETCAGEALICAGAHPGEA